MDMVGGEGGTFFLLRIELDLDDALEDAFEDARLLALALPSSEHIETRDAIFFAPVVAAGTTSRDFSTRV